MNRELFELEWASGGRGNSHSETAFMRLRTRVWAVIVRLMRKGRQSWATGILPIAVLIAMLLTLIILQLRWSREVSEAERVRLEQNLSRSTASFQSTFSRDLIGLCRSLETPESTDMASFKGEIFMRYGAWLRFSGRAPLVEGIYFRRSTRPAALLEFDPQHNTLAPAAWPQSVKSAFKRNHSLPRQPDRWVWDGRMPGLVHAVYIARGASAQSEPAHLRPYGYLVVLLDAKYLEQHYLPEIAQREFPATSGFLFQIVHEDGLGMRSVIYRSSSAVPEEVFTRADQVASLLPESHVAAQKDGAFEPVFIENRQPGWWILVRHHAGSVGAAAIELRHRNLGISIAVLLVLAASLLIIVLTTARARRLARREMEFATGVSHELRTPLAVIRSAAENLADGVVTEAGRVREYGAMIHREGLRLSTMVDHILDFSALRSEARQYKLEAVPAASVIETAKAGSQLLAHAAGMTIESKLADNLPLLATDAGALRQCLENLMNNAVKYGKAGGRIEISASYTQGRNNQACLTVRDYGPGIAPEDRPYIFDPFYRGARARNSAARGTGLGLSLTREIIEALGGRVTIDSSPGKGAAFTLHVPIVSSGARGPAVPESSRPA